MHDPRTSTALRRLAELTGDQPPRLWAWSVGRLDHAGRLSLGRAATSLLGTRPLRLRWHNLALLVDVAEDAAGPSVSIDERGRLLVPAWLRQRGRDVLVGLRAEEPQLLIAPVEVLDRLGDVLAEGAR